MNQKTGKSQPPKPGIMQPKTAIASQMKKPPVAPPVYRPQPAPKVLQTKSAFDRQTHIGQLPRQPVAPPVYRPQPKAKLLQTKPAKPEPAAQQTAARTTPAAPPAYRPNNAPPVMQRRNSHIPAGQAKGNSVARPALAQPPTLFKRGFPPTIQRLASQASLKALSDKAFAMDGSTIEVQAMGVGNQVLLAGNKSSGTRNVHTTVADQKKRDKPAFATTVGGLLGETIEYDNEGEEIDFSVMKAPDIATALDKKGRGLITYTEEHDSRHAEQQLLVILAKKMSTNKTVGDVNIAGRNIPCRKCLKVLTAFSKAYNLMKYGTLTFRRDDPDQVRRGIVDTTGILDLTVECSAEYGLMPVNGTAADKFKKFINLYTKILAETAL
jgi:hypothetical protein